MKKFDYKDNKLIIKFSVDSYDFPHVLAVVKSLENRQFDAINKVWIASATEKNITVLLDNDFQASPNVPRKDVPYVIAKTPQKEVDRSKLPIKMRPYQIKGVSFLEAVDGNGIIGDAPRLGKSLQAIGYCMLHPEYERILIICPANVKIVWKDQIQEWLQEKSLLLYGKTPYNLNNIKERVVIVNYDILYNWLLVLLNIKFDVLIVDEFQYLCNDTIYNSKLKKTVLVKRTVAYKKLGAHILHKPHLSGTPIKSGPYQFFNSLHIIAPKVFNTKWKYLQYYCAPKMTKYGWDFSGMTMAHADELYKKISPYMIRRKKEDVFTDLPKKQRIVVRFEEDKSEDKKNELKEKIEWIKDFLDSGEKLVCFAWNRNICESIYNVFKSKAVLVYGGISSIQKDKLQQKFQNDPHIQLFVGQIISTNVGISLSAADTVAFVQLPYNPADLEQAEERVFMPGDGKEHITIYYFVGENSKEEKIALNIDRKDNIVLKTVDNKKSTGILYSNTTPIIKAKRNT